MRKMAFYPGCSLESMNRDYLESIDRAATALDVKLVEIKDWTCCGASAAHSLDEGLSVALPAGSLKTAQAMGCDVAVACPQCFKRLKHSKQELQEQKTGDSWSINPDLLIEDLARVLTTKPMLDRIKQDIVTPLNGLRVVSYYGCQVVRHPKITEYEEYENPTHLDLLADALGAVAVDWSFKTVCCGAGLAIPRKQMGLHLIKRLLTQAHASGAQAILVCCPLCQTNLDLYQRELCRQNGWDFSSWSIPVLYYTELLSLALGDESILQGLKGHIVDPVPLLERVLGR
ncbi:MAG: CoB--CoM heterodisulfide reductase iron-sulfur subunit B family protein [Syntrophobacteraceae bacterium]